MRTILSRYVFREILTPFFVSLFVFTGILFLARSLKLIDLVVTKSASVWQIISLFLLIIPQFLEIALPMSLLLGIILAFGRLSGDSELVVMRTSGISLRQLVRPVLIAATFCFVVSLAMSVWIRPWANLRLGIGLFELAKVKASSGLVPGIFNELSSLTIYVERMDESGSELTNVLISDRRDPQKPRVFIAKHGEIIPDNSARTLGLRLHDGTIHEGRGVNYNVTYFDINNIVLSQSDLVEDELAREGKKANEMYLAELLERRHALREKRRVIEDLGKKDQLQLGRYEVELHRRFAIPFISFAIALIGMALGVQPSRGGKSWGMAVNITVGILVITIYYFALAFATALGEQAVMPAWFVMWAPDVMFSALAFYLFERVESEEWMAVSQALGDFLWRAFSKFKFGGASA